MRTVAKAKIPSSEASDTIPRLMKMGLVERSAKISKEGDFRSVPVTESAVSEIEAMGYEVSEGPAYTLERRSPQERILEASQEIPENLKSMLPMRWEFVGDIAIIKIGRECEPYKKTIGEIYAKVLNVSPVCADAEGVSGELRRPSTEVIFGTGTESVRLENGIRYEMDVVKVMYASGNTDERYRMRELDCKGETVVDMFSGIGYFTLPIARFTGARRVFACEKNPDSYHYLIRNIKNNNVADNVIPILADNRDLFGTDYADRILMGYVQRTSEFLPKAAEMIKVGGMIHYHDTFYVKEHLERISSIFRKVFGRDGFDIEMIREVKSFAPSVSHFVADVRIL